MSHEIRTPLNGVVGMIDLIEQTDLRPLQKEYFQTVKESSENLIYVVNQIMDISKLDSGKMSLETSNFSVYDLFNECVKVFSDIANEKGLKLSFIPCANRDFWVNADKYRLKQIVVNLLSNAIKYSDKGTIVLHYVCASTSENGIKLRFCISDYGIGISQDDQKTLFDNYAQLEDFSTKEHDGIGLGLPITKKIVDLLGGSIELESELDKGSSFKVELELSKAIKEEVKSDKVIEAKMEAVKNPRALIVDDKTVNIIVLRTMMNSLGFTTDTD